MQHIKYKDSGIKAPTKIATYPGINNPLTLTTPPISTNGQYNIMVRVFGDSDRLGLWNHNISVVIDDNTTFDGDGQFTYIFPNGSGWSSGDDALNLYVNVWEDWAHSDDASNTRAIIISLKNYGSNPHTYYFYYAGYTFVAVAAGV